MKEKSLPLSYFLHALHSKEVLVYVANQCLVLVYVAHQCLVSTHTRLHSIILIFLNCY